MEYYNRNAIVLAGDYAYIRQIETTLKSICYYNNNLKIYIFNQDIPGDWFTMLRSKLSLVGVELIDIKLLDEEFDLEWTAGFSHIDYMAFARYFIPKYVDEDIVLYLDSDLVVTGNILHLFETDLGENSLGAVYALHGMTAFFNSGVLLINNKRWKEENVFDHLIDLTRKEWKNVDEGDQSILNMLFKGKWTPLESKYNFPIGYDYGAFCLNQDSVFEIPLDPIPLILHYISSDKPWLTYSKGRLREVWWFYNGLDWSEIIEKSGVEVDKQIKLIEFRKQAFTLTNAQEMEHLLELVASLPEYHFHIAAYTPMGNILLRYEQYPNVSLYPNVMPVIIDQLITQSDVYLDINHGNKFTDIILKAKEKGKEIIAFDTTQQEDVEEQIFPTSEPEKLINYLKNL